MTDTTQTRDNESAIVNEFENIIPWNGMNDTGRDVRLKWERNFARVASNFSIIIEELKNCLRKDRPDSTNFLLSLLGGAKIGKNLTFGEFITNVSGGMIDEKGIAELESLFLRSELIVPAIRYNFMTYFMGYNIISPGGGLKVKDFTDNGDGTWTVVPDLDEGIPCGQYVDDMLTGFWYDKTATSGDFAGFRKMQFRVMSVDYDAKTFVMAPRPDTESVPYKELKLGQTGNITNEERQTYIVIDTRDGSNCITFFDHANTWDPEPAQMPAWFGKKKGMTVQGINADNYSAVLQNIIMTGLIFQTDEITGESVRVPLWKGEWVKGKYGYFNEVSHNGSRWLCVNSKGTEQEPGTGVDWMVTVKKGEDGAPGLSVVGGGHWEASKTPYAANTMVTLANCVFLSNVETSNPPIRISRFKSGNYRRMKNGGYILAGKSVDWEVHSDWTMLLDGRELKGTSITFLGSFASAPANPKEGNSYYNTTDKCTYVYQNGVWMLMVSDGKDGRDYEYIYYRNNTIGVIPDKPDSQQQDNYVPEGWTADYLGVSEEYQVEWGCKRIKLDGVWSGWSTPAVVHRWSKDGESNVLADLDNEMVSCALTYEGKTTSSVSWVTNVGMWYGLEELDLTSISYADNGVFSVSANKETGAVTISVQNNVSVPDTTNIRLTLTASKSGQIYSRDLVFTIAGVRAGSDGEDAVVYSLIPSATSVVKYKDGSYNVPSVSCTRQKTVGSTISETTDGELKYSLDGGAEQNASNGQAISSGLITKSVKFLLYVSGKLVDVETIPLITDGHDGTNGVDGTSMNPRGNWVSSGVPYYKNDLVNFAYGTFVALRQTNNPPFPISRFKNGSYRRKKDGGYILAGNGTTLNEDWQVVTPPTYPGSYWLDCPVSSIGISSVGRPSPSSVLVTCKMNIRNSVQLCGDFYLVARKYNGSWIAHVSPVKSFELSVPATAGYTQFAVRAYRTASDASEWNENYVCEKGIGVSVDGSSGADAAFMYDNGPWKSGTTYVWNDTRRDKVIHPFNGVYYNFLVKNKGASVTAAPTSADGDANWEDMNELINIATGSLFADGANVANFLFKKGVLRSQDETDGVANIIMNGKTGYFHCSKADITGTINAIGGNFKNVTVQGTFRTKESGDRIELSTDTNTFSFIGSNNVHYMQLFFNISGSTKSARMTLNDDYGNVTTLSPGSFNLDFNFSGVPADDNGETLTTLNYGLQIYNRTKDRLVFISPRKIQFNEGGTIYLGYTGTAEYVPPNGYSKTLYFKNGILYKIG